MSEWLDIIDAGKPNRYWRNLTPAPEPQPSVGLAPESSLDWNAIKNLARPPYWDDPMLKRVKARIDNEEDVSV